MQNPTINQHSNTLLQTGSYERLPLLLHPPHMLHATSLLSLWGYGSPKERHFSPWKMQSARRVVACGFALPHVGGFFCLLSATHFIYLIKDADVHRKGTQYFALASRVRSEWSITIARAHFCCWNLLILQDGSMGSTWTTHTHQRKCAITHMPHSTTGGGAAINSSRKMAIRERERLYGFRCESEDHTTPGAPPFARRRRIIVALFGSCDARLEN